MTTVPLLPAVPSPPAVLNPPASGEFLVRSVQRQSRTTVGTQDFVVTDFGTPIAWVVTVNHCTTVDTIRAGAGQNIGWQETTGPDTEAVFFGAAETSSNYASSAFGGGSGVIRVLTLGSTAVDFTATAATTTDGITLTYVNPPTTALTITVDLIACDNAVAGDATSGGPVTGLLFEPTAILTMSANGISVPTNGWRGGLGFAAQTTGGTITQGSWNHRFTGGLSAPVRIGQVARNGAFATTLSSTLVESYQTLDSFDSGGFTYTSTGTAFGFSYLALRAADSNFWTGWTATRTTTGVQDVDVGFAAAGGWIMSTFLPSLNTVVSATDVESSGFHSWNGEEQFSSTVSLEDDPVIDPANAHSLATTEGLSMLGVSGTLDIEATVSGDPDGFAVNYSNVDPTGRQYLALVWEPIMVTQIVTTEDVEVEDSQDWIRGLTRVTTTEVVEVEDAMESMVIEGQVVSTTGPGMLSQVSYPRSERSVLSHPASEASNLVFP